MGAFNTAFRDVGRQGVTYKEQSRKLYVFGRGEVTVMRPWPPAAWTKTKARPWWSPTRPQVVIRRGDLGRRVEVLGDRSGANASMLSWLRWGDNIPREARGLVVSFPDRHWHLLSMLARCGEPAYDLVRSNPAVAFALASSWVFHQPRVQWPMRSVRSLLAPGRSQREALEWLGFPGTDAARRIVAKLIPGATTVNGLLYLRGAVANAGAAKVMAHLPRLNAGVLRIASDQALLSACTGSFLTELATDPREARRPRAARLLHMVIERARLAWPDSSDSVRVRSSQHLLDLHESLRRRLSRLSDRTRNLPFPAPPIPGTTDILPLTSVEALQRESAEQNNCVAHYAHLIAIRRSHYVYKVLEPERCTLAIVRRSGRWEISELEAWGNREASDTTRRLVGMWLGGNPLESWPSLEMDE